MGLFYMCKSDYNADRFAAEKIFEEKKSGKPEKFTYGEWDICFYEKQISKSSDLYKDEQGFILVSGTVMYGKLKKEQVLKALFTDFIKNTIDFSKLAGHYNIIIGFENKITIITDKGESNHLFCHCSYRFISSSMLACAAAFPEKLNINKKAVMEKMAISIIMAPDTLFEEIYCINREIVARINAEHIGVEIMNTESGIGCDIKFDNNFQSCVQSQIESLDGFFEQLKSYSEGELVDTGLSAGYDSRLILAMMARHFPKRMHIHTHSTKGVHDGEKKIAQRLAELLNLKCTAVDTLPLGEVDNAQGLMKENVYFFDGRSSFVIGGFNETYTADYRICATEKSNASLTGVGGEVYRNYYHVLKKNKTLGYYLKKYICNPQFAAAVGKENYTETLSFINNKAEKRLGCKSNDKGHILFRRYYSEIMMADGQGVMLDAYNQVSDCFAPFIDTEILKTAYTDTAVLGFDGEFEAAMINKINPKMAKINSSYGHSLVNIPKKYIIKQLIRAIIPENIWNGIASVVKRTKINTVDSKLQRALDGCDFYRNAFEFFKKQFPNVDFDILFKGKYELKNISMTVVTVYLMKEKLMLSE